MELFIDKDGYVAFYDHDRAVFWQLTSGGWAAYNEADQQILQTGQFICPTQKDRDEAYERVEE